MPDTTQELEHELSLVARIVRAPVTLPDGTVVQRSTCSLLRLLTTQGPLRVGVVAAAFSLDPSTTTRQVQTAVRDGLVLRMPDPADARASLLDLTDLGRQVDLAVAQQQREGLALVLAGWPDHERDELVRLLRAFNASVASLRTPPGFGASVTH